MWVHFQTGPWGECVCVYFLFFFFLICIPKNVKWVKILQKATAVKCACLYNYHKKHSKRQLWTWALLNIFSLTEIKIMKKIFVKLLAKLLLFAPPLVKTLGSSNGICAIDWLVKERPIRLRQARLIIQQQQELRFRAEWTSGWERGRASERKRAIEGDCTHSSISVWQLVPDNTDIELLQRRTCWATLFSFARGCQL